MIDSSYSQILCGKVALKICAEFTTIWQSFYSKEELWTCAFKYQVFLLLLSCIFLIYLFEFFFKSFRVSSQVKLYLQVKFLPEFKKSGITPEFQPRAKRIPFTSFHSVLDLYLRRFATYFTKIFYGESTFVCSSKILILDFINKSNKMFDFKMFKMSYWLQSIQ